MQYIGNPIPKDIYQEANFFNLHFKEELTVEQFIQGFVGSRKINIFYVFQLPIFLDITLDLYFIFSKNNPIYI